MLWYPIDKEQTNSTDSLRGYKAMVRFVQHCRGWCRWDSLGAGTGTALCTSGTLWSDQRAHHAGHGSWGSYHDRAPLSVTPHLLHIPAGRKLPSLALAEDDGELLLDQRHLDFCLHSLTWAITAPSQFILITGANTTWARILMPWLASQEPCSFRGPSLLVYAPLPQPSQERFWIECSIALEWWHI